jgi:hypothetical protein
MITGFRIGAVAVERDDLIERLLNTVGYILDLPGQPPGEWECTQDVTSKTETGYQGRMNFVFHPAAGENENGEEE